MAKFYLDNDRKRALFVTFTQEYDSYSDQSTQGGEDDGYRLEVSGMTVIHELDGSDMRSEWSSSNGLGSFKVIGRTSRKEHGKPIRCGVEYRDMTVVSANDAKQMVKVFATVENALAKADERDGYYRTIGQYMARVARAVGATSIIFDKPGSVSRGSYDANSDQHVWLKLGHAVDAIDSRINLWVERRQEERQTNSGSRY